ncbi:MAG: GGDEF domain-containing protein [Peptostreptococcaceae bacterium]|nr:GGDEF domain-containing protein [Peptostreptococcaceae bacterium]
MYNLLESLFDKGYYLVAVFSGDGDLMYANQKFRHFFMDLKHRKELENLILAEEITDGRQESVAVDSKGADCIVRFRLSYEGQNCMFMGEPISYEEFLKENPCFSVQCPRGSLLPENSVKFHSAVYSTLVFDKDWQLKYFSENTFDVLGEGEYIGKSLEEIFGREIAEGITAKTHYFRVFEDVTIDVVGKMLVVSELRTGYKVINIYPYSRNTMNKFEEMSRLHYQIRNLEKELADRDKFIKTQKEIFKNLTTVDGLTKLYNRRYLIERFSAEMKKIAQSGRTFAMTNFDIENFKQINREIGFEKADDLLKYLSMLIKKRLDPNRDTAFRIGSAEFLVLSLHASKETAKEQFSMVSREFEEHTGLPVQMNIFDSNHMDMSIIGLYREKKENEEA